MAIKKARSFPSFLLTDIGEALTLAPAARRGARQPGEADLGVRKNIAIVVKNGRIAWLGPKVRLPKEMARERLKEVSLNGQTVMPSLCECHTHLVFAGNRQDEFERRNLGASYQEVAASGGGIAKTVRATRSASLPALTRAAQKRVDRFVAQGVTTIEVKSGYGLNLESETKQLKVARALSGARIVSTYLGAHSVPSEYSSAERYIERLIAQDLREIARQKWAERADIFIENGYFLPPLAKKYLTEARKLGLDLVVHGEQLSHTGATRLAVELGARSVDHLVQIDSVDIEALASSTTTAVLLPTADFYLHLSYPPARKLLDAGVRVALATDFNPGSSPTQDVSLVGVLARLEMKMSLPEVIVAYTLGGAYALGKEADLGSLEVGKTCDLISLDGNWDELFYQVGHHPVDRVWCRGIELKKN